MRWPGNDRNAFNRTALYNLLKRSDECHGLRCHRRFDRLFRSLVALICQDLRFPPKRRPPPPVLDFNRDIRPVLSENCFYCHGQDGNKRQAELRLDVREAAIEAGAIVPRSPALERADRADPLGGSPEAHAAAEVEPTAVGRTEEAPGAMDRRGGRVCSALGVTSRPRVRPSPRCGEPTGCAIPIDRFVLAKLEAESLAPSPEADRATLIKRLSIDLVGLPPSPEEVDAFVADRDPEAYDKLVDRLLASPTLWRTDGARLARRRAVRR